MEIKDSALDRSRTFFNRAALTLSLNSLDTAIVKATFDDGPPPHTHTAIHLTLYLLNIKNRSR